MAEHPQQNPRRFSKTAALCYADGESSDNDEEAEAQSSERGMCGQFVWPCPREYPQTLRGRQAKKWLIPADLSKEDFGKLFKKIATSRGQGPNLVKIHVRCC